MHLCKYVYSCDITLRVHVLLGLIKLLISGFLMPCVIFVVDLAFGMFKRLILVG